MKLELILKVDDNIKQKLIVDILEKKDFYKSIPSKAYDIQIEEIDQGRKLVTYKYNENYANQNIHNYKSVYPGYKYGTMRFNSTTVVEKFEEPDLKVGTIWIQKRRKYK